MKYKETGTVISQKMISDAIYEIYIQTGKIAAEARPGQFVNLYSDDRTKILPRPISICGIDADKGILRLVYRVSGQGTGTNEFSQKKAGEPIVLMGPLGNGFPMEEALGKRVALVGGGIGVPPMVETARQLSGKAKVVSVMGYRSDTFLKKDFALYGEVLTATEDGSDGTKGTVIDAMKANDFQADVMFACGPAPMLRALKTYCADHDIALWVSMEERMACGIGACLACTCNSTEVDDHSKVKNKRVCADGPVFAASEVEI